MMQFHRKLTSRTSHVVMLSLVVTGLFGCGQAETDRMWQDVSVIYYEQDDLLEYSDPGDQEALRMTSELVVGAIQSTLARYPNASEGLRRVLSDIRDGEQRLADGQVTGSEADELRRRHQEYWSYLMRQELPPDYR